MATFIPFNIKPKQENFNNPRPFHTRIQESGITLRTLGGIFLHK